MIEGGCILDSNKVNNQSPLVYIIILNWNGTEDTLECLESFRKVDYSSYKTIVVDNSSKVSCKGEVLARYPTVEVIELENNLGFAGGCNVGIKRAIDEGANYVWLLNNDTEVEPNALTTMVKEGEKNTRAGILGSKIYYFDERHIINHTGGRVVPHKWHITIHVGAGEVDVGQYNEVKEFDYVTGCSMLVKREVIEQIGLMDEKYFLYYEETDWCLKAKKAGWSIIYVPESVIYHKVSRSIQKNSPLRNYYFARNSLRFIVRNFPFMLIFALYWWPRYFFINHLLKRRYEHLKMSVRGLRDFFYGRYGKYES